LRGMRWSEWETEVRKHFSTNQKLRVLFNDCDKTYEDYFEKWSAVVRTIIKLEIGNMNSYV